MIKHCNDVDSYYFPGLNECYHIYQMPVNNLDPNYAVNRNELTYGTSQFCCTTESSISRSSYKGENAISEKSSAVILSYNRAA
uniref:Uncharacterized protein n=1 Tax=Onchocerca volvulus TaxID=6282 RepID=A0A8R1TKD8_ONCVO